MAERELLSLDEAAGIFGVDRRTVLRWAIEGTFPGNAAVKIGKSWRVSRPRLDTYLHGGNEGPDAA